MKKDYKPGDKVRYTGRGFLNFDPERLEMTFLEKDTSSLKDVWVDYYGHRMLVSDHDIEPEREFKKGDIIQYNKGTYKILENHGEYGTVQERPDGEIVENFIWDFGGFESILIASEEIEVTKCIECPGYHAHICSFPKRRVEDYDGIPDWCPLKSGPVIVRLKG